MDWGEILLTILFDLIITVFFYLLVPVIYCLRKKSLTKKQIRKIVIINGVVVWLIFRILTLALTGEAGTGAAVFLWSAVADWLLKKYCLVEEDEEKSAETPQLTKRDISVEVSETVKPEQDAQKSLSYKDEPQKTYGNYNIAGSDIRYNPEGNHSTPEKKVVQPEMPPSKAIRYCSRCGGEIATDTKKCTKCGKQYFKGFTKKGIALIVVSILLVLSLVSNLMQAIDAKDYQEIIREKINENAEISSIISKIRSEYEFYDEHAVCVSNINDYYHKYGCSRFDDSEFWIFNLEYAEYQGYKPCPYCCDKSK